MGANTYGGAARLGGCWAHSDVLREGVMQTIVCAVDDSPGAAEAVSVAAGLCKDLRLRLVLAHVVDGDGRTHGRGVDGVQAHEEGRRLLERVAFEQSLDSAADRRAE